MYDVGGELPDGLVHGGDHAAQGERRCGGVVGEAARVSWVFARGGRDEPERVGGVAAEDARVLQFAVERVDGGGRDVEGGVRGVDGAGALEGLDGVQERGDAGVVSVGGLTRRGEEVVGGGTVGGG